MTSLLALAARFVLAPLARFWAWLAADPIRLAFAILIAVCAFLGWRLSSIDADRDNWREQVREYETASKIVEEADRAADAEALDVAAETVKGIEDGNARAKAAADASDDGLRAAFDELRPKGDNGRGKAAK